MDYKDIVKQITKDIVSRMGYSVNVDWIKSDNNTLAIVSITSIDKIGSLIGKEGANMASIEHIIRVLVSRACISQNIIGYPLFMLDINGYRQQHIQIIIANAQKVAKQVSISRRAQSLGPMTSYERRIIHAQLSSMNDIITESFGEDPNRSIIIKPSIVDLN